MSGDWKAWPGRCGTGALGQLLVREVRVFGSCIAWIENSRSAWLLGKVVVLGCWLGQQGSGAWLRDPAGACANVTDGSAAQGEKLDLENSRAETGHV